MPVTSMPAIRPPCPDEPADDVVLGVDTHKDVHVAAVVTRWASCWAPSPFPTTAAGLPAAAGLGARFRRGAPGRGGMHRLLRRRAGPLPAAGDVAVIEVNQPDRATRRSAARPTPSTPRPPPGRCCPGRATTTAKTGDGPVEMMRVFKLAKDSASNARTQAINQLKAVLVGADPAAAGIAVRAEQPGH